MHERHGAEAAAGRAEQRKRDRVISTEHEEVRRAGEQVVRAALDLFDRLREIERRGDEVACVRNLLRREGLHVQGRVVGPEEP